MRFDGKRISLRDSGRFILLLSLLGLLLLLSACGEQSAEMGRYRCVAASSEGFALDPETLYPEGVELELGSGGKGLLRVGEELGTLRWSLDGTRLRLNIGGERCEGSLEDGMLRIVLPGERVELRFLRADIPAPTALPAADYAAAAEAWCGDWFGRWTVSGAEGRMPETWYDCCAVLTAEEEGRVVRLRLWDEDTSREQPMALVDFAIDPERPEQAKSIRGGFWLETLEPGAWVLERSAWEFPDALLLRGRYEAEGERFDYEILLRPWGRLWDDVQAEDSMQLPFRYEWYLEQLESGAAMPDALPPAG